MGISPSARRRTRASLPLAVSLVVAVLTALALPLRRVWPGPVFGWTVLAAAVLAQWPDRGALFPVALAIALYTVAATMRRAAALAAAVLAWPAWWSPVVAPGRHASLGGWRSRTPPGLAAAVLVVGLYVGTRRAYLAELRDRARRLERERDQTSALAAAVERARIAREMHDSVAHHLTVIVALSDGALAARHPRARRGGRCDPRRVGHRPRGAGRDPAPARRAAGRCRAGARGSRCPAWPTSTICSAGSGRPACRSGTSAAAPAADLPPGLQLAVFRLVQEALTNTMKHGGPGASAAVRLQLTPAEVRVEVEDDGAGRAAEPGAPGGGLTGMRERVSAFGGELTCGPRQPRGWRVTARLGPDPAAAS